MTANTPDDLADFDFWLKDAASILRSNGTVAHAEWVEKASTRLRCDTGRESTVQAIADWFGDDESCSNCGSLDVWSGGCCEAPKYAKIADEIRRKWSPLRPAGSEERPDATEGAR